jgi:hypothetical protein
MDRSLDNIENRVNGACVRYLNMVKNASTFSVLPTVLFGYGDCCKSNFKNGDAMWNDASIQIVKSIFATDSKDAAIAAGKGIERNYGKAEMGFHISSCQFALHYFFESLPRLHGFLRNVTECTRMNGFFIGTCYDGKKMFELLRSKQIQKGESIQILSTSSVSSINFGSNIIPTNDHYKLWEITRQYEDTHMDYLEDNEKSLGLQIDVFQESINQTI